MEVSPSLLGQAKLALSTGQAKIAWNLDIEWASARVPPTPIFGALQIFSVCHLFW